MLKFVKNLRNFSRLKENSSKTLVITGLKHNFECDEKKELSRFRPLKLPNFKMRRINKFNSCLQILLSYNTRVSN